MNYKKVTFKSILFCVILLLCTLSFSQSNDASLKHIDKLALKMFTDMNNRDYDAILEMTHPKVFEMAPKESIKEVFKGLFEGNEEFSMDIPKIVPAYKLSKIFKIEKDHLEYAFVTYDMRMKMSFLKQEFDDASKEMMKTMMEPQGMEVTFISNKTLDIVMNNRITIILKDDTTNNKWVMVNYDPDSPLFYNIVPTSLIESAKSYKQDLMLESKKNNED